MSLDDLCHKLDFYCIILIMNESAHEPMMRTRKKPGKVADIPKTPPPDTQQRIVRREEYTQQPAEEPGIKIRVRETVTTDPAGGFRKRTSVTPKPNPPF